MSGVYVPAADDFPAFCFEGIYLIQEAVVESEFELNEVIASSSVGKVDIEKYKVAEIGLNDTSLMVELFDTEAEFDADRIYPGIKGCSRITFAFCRLEPALISRNVRYLRSQLFLKGLDLLDSYDVRADLFEAFRKTLSCYCSYSVDIPARYSHK